jgi:hypothetical protein
MNKMIYIRYKKEENHMKFSHVRIIYVKSYLRRSFVSDVS